MVQEMHQSISIIPTCIASSCLPSESILILTANILLITLLIGLAHRHVQKGQA